MNNKYTHLLLFILTLISFRSFGQVYEIDTYNGQTISTCKGEFTSSNGNYYDCIDPFGSTNGYRNNENYTITFCSGTPGRPLRVSFISWDIEATYDFLYVYDGNSTAAPLLATISGSSDIFTTGDLFFTSTGTCLTFKFTSDGSTRYCGWDAIIGCEPIDCNGNPAPADNCVDAPQICDLDAYCGNTTGWFTSDNTDLGTTGTPPGVFCGSIENNSWLKFVPSRTTASFEFNSSNCLYAGSGIQAMILSSTDCSNFTAVSNCTSQGTAAGTFTLTTNTPLVPGKPYYIMIDGFGGNLCDYTVRSLNGIQLITLSSDAPSNTICDGNTATITAHNALPGTTYSWSPTATIIGSSTDSFITVNPTTNTTYVLNAILPNGCSLFTDSLTIKVNPNKASTRNDAICPGGSVTVGTSTYTEEGTYYDTLSTSLGCDSVVTTNLTLKAPTTDSITQSICQGQSVTIGSQTFNITGIYSVTLTNSANCDSIVTLDLNVSDSIVVNLNETICSGSSYSAGGQTFNSNGSYTVTLQSSAGCDSIIHLDLTVVSSPTIDATADAVIVKSGVPIQLGVSTSEVLNYNWTPAGQVSDPTAQNPTATITAPTWFVVTAMNDNECSSKDSVFVDLELDICTVFIPNAFSPNGDGVNDILKVRSTALKSISLVITNRWGNKVYETKDVNNTGWDGLYKGQPAEVGVYGYYFVGECIQGDKKTLKGSITLLR